MKYLPNVENFKIKTLRPLILTSLTIAGMVATQPTFAEGKVTYNPLDESVHIPTAHVGSDQYEVKMKYESGQNRFVLTEVKLVSMLTFKDRDNPVFSKTLTLSEMLVAFPPVEVDVWEFIENRQMKFRGFPTTAVFDSIYGPEWRQKEQLSFTALDGYQSSIPVESLIQYDSYIAYEYADTKKRPLFVSVKDSDAKFVDLGPFWLVWDNLTKPDLQARVSYGWPYQLAGIEFIKFVDQYPNSAPPAGSPENVQRGFVDAAVPYCMNCHKIRGDGGTKGPELTGRITNLTDQRLKEVLLDINALPNVTGMVLREEIANREQVADDIIAYLRVMDAIQ